MYRSVRKADGNIQRAPYEYTYGVRLTDLPKTELCKILVSAKIGIGRPSF